MSMGGGTMRIGQFIGPLLGGLLIIPFGLVAPFCLQALFAVAAAVTLWSGHRAARRRRPSDEESRSGCDRSFSDNRGTSGRPGWWR